MGVIGALGVTWVHSGVNERLRVINRVINRDK